MESDSEVSEGTGIDTHFLVCEEGLFLEDFEREEDVDFIFVLGVEGKGLKVEGLGI